jgi:acyl carrier protein
VAYIVPHQDRVPYAGDLYDALKEKLPDYMLPAAFMVIEALPINPNGKLDRRALPAYDPARSLARAFVAPGTPIETALVDIWVDVLKVKQVGIRDNFFALGGNSLLATQIMSRLRSAFEVELPVRSLFETPTIAELSQVIEQHQKSEMKIKQSAITPLSRQLYRTKRA